jgi:hypothetical protein
MVIPANTRTVAIAAAVLWLAVTVVLLTAHWSLSCTVDGQDAGGIDCLQENTMPHAGSAPASWFGFVPLALLWLTLSGVLVWCARVARRH